MDVSNEYSLILFDVPSVEYRHQREAYTTIPLGLILVNDVLLTVCAEATPVLKNFLENTVKEFSTKKQMRFIYQIFLRSCMLYQSYLRIIDRKRKEIEAHIGDDTEEMELIDLHELESNLVYFDTSLRANKVVLDRLMRYSRIKKYPEDQDLLDDVVASDVLMCVKAHELIAEQCPYPLHVGITESGTVYSGNVKSSVGLGIILYEGIGNTIRVSLTGDPVEEIRTAKLILKTLGLRKGGIEVVSCPTCGRTRIDLIGLANQVENMVADIPLDLKVAVMGCVVNGPGEAKEADIGIAGGVGEGLLIKKGEVVRKVPEAELLSVLREELLHWNDEK